MEDKDELLEVVDEAGKVLRLALRSELHRDPSLLHRVVHVLVFDDKGRLLLQKRSMYKDVAPGKWDTSVGGHVNLGEDVKTAAMRELNEELGITQQNIRFLYAYIISNQRESELVSTFTCVYNGRIVHNRDEIDEVRFWDLVEINENLCKGIFSIHFEKEFRAYLTEQGEIGDRGLT